MKNLGICNLFNQKLSFSYSPLQFEPQNKNNNKKKRSKNNEK